VREKTPEKVKKLIGIANAASLNPGRTPDELAALLKINKAELLASLETLSLCGLPPYGPGDLFDTYIEDGKVFIHHAYGLFERPVRLDRAEGLALLVAGRASGRGGSRNADLDSALRKVRDAIAPGEAGGIERISEQLDISPETGNLRPLLDTLKAASGREKVVIEYFTPARRETACRTVRPYGLIYDVERWYLVGWCESRHELRVFRVDRIKSARPAGERFDMPAGFDLARFRREEMFRFIERPHKVRISYKAAAPGAEPAEAEFNTESLESVVSTIFGLARRATAVSPPELRRLVRKAAQDTLKLYE
jgi:predicted DNA-binding transcriptional regulator YafY